MVKLSKIFAYFLFFILALIYFVPKLNLYYYAENELQNYKVILLEKVKKDTGFSLRLDGVEVFYDSIAIAKAKSADLKLFLMYNSLNIKDIELSGMASSFVPIDIKTVDIRYSILNPLNIMAKVDGGFGVADVELNIVDRDITIDLVPSKLMLQKYKNTLKNFSKTADKGYRYVKTF